MRLRGEVLKQPQDLILWWKQKGTCLFCFCLIFIMKNSSVKFIFVLYDLILYEWYLYNNISDFHVASIIETLPQAGYFYNFYCYSFI